MSNFATEFVKKEQKDVDEFLAFVNASPSPFHCVDTSEKLLLEKGFSRLQETDSWDLKPGGKYFFTRNQSTIIAFAVGEKFVPGNGFSICVAHTDSPCPKLKPVSHKTKLGYIEVGVQLYGGGLWNTWFDRDLSLAGRVVVDLGDGKFESKLVRINRPIMRIPHLAIHLYREIYSEGFKPNKEKHVVPVLATAIKNKLASGDDEKSNGDAVHSPMLLELLASELGVKADQIRTFELCLYDTQPSCTGGLFNEFIFAPRLDNQMMSFCSLKALLNSLDATGLKNEPNVRMVALFDNEEIGSQSAYGAASGLLLSSLRRIHGDDGFEQSLQRSFMISADMAHAIHPNYPEKHEDKHHPKMHKGLVIKHNCNQRYATTAVTDFILNELARRHDIPMQAFVVRQDSGCGSTLGPILSSRCGIRTVDVGAAQLSMHSVREMCGTEDVSHSINIFTHFFSEFPELDANTKVD